MPIVASALSDPGLIRFNNEDSFYCDEECGVFAVADGVGGAKAGEVASAAFCEVVKEHRDAFKKALAQDVSGHEKRNPILRLMERVFDRASERVYRMAENNPDYRGMATTGIVLAMGPSGGVLGHVGDSRAYLLRGAEVRRLTTDHSLAQEMIAQGLLKEDELEDFPHKNILARAVGQLPTVRVDTAWLEVSPGDSVLLCSDGLYRYFQDAQLKDVLRFGVEGAIEAAKAKGGEDNVTALVLKVSGTPVAAPSMLDTQSKIVCLQNMFLFRYLNYPELVRVLKIVFEKRFKIGDAVFKEGEAGDSLFLVVEGAVEVQKEGHYLTSVGPGGHFGEVAFMDGRPRSATVTTTEATTLLSIRRDDFRALARTDPVIASKLLWCFVLNLSGRVRELSANYVKALDPS